MFSALEFAKELPEPAQLAAAFRIKRAKRKNQAPESKMNATQMKVLGCETLAQCDELSRRGGEIQTPHPAGG